MKANYAYSMITRHWIDDELVFNEELFADNLEMGLNVAFGYQGDCQQKIHQERENGGKISLFLSLGKVW